MGEELLEGDDAALEWQYGEDWDRKVVKELRKQQIEKNEEKNENI
jgi:hypothetical protein